MSLSNRVEILSWVSGVYYVLEDVTEYTRTILEINPLTIFAVILTVEKVVCATLNVVNTTLNVVNTTLDVVNTILIFVNIILNVVNTILTVYYARNATYLICI